MQEITFQQEKLTDIKPEMQFLQRHWEEIALNKDKIALDPNWDLYDIIENNDTLVITTARDSGKLIGYFVYLICPNLHYRNLVVAEGDVFYLDKEYRKSGIASRLLKESEKNVKKAGANKIINKTKVHFENAHRVPAGMLFERAGYTHIENIYAKLLD